MRGFSATVRFYCAMRSTLAGALTAAGNPRTVECFFRIFRTHFSEHLVYLLLLVFMRGSIRIAMHSTY